jgi:hypothetical protein
MFLAAGTPLFKGEYEKHNLRLLRAKSFASGAVVLYYRPEG